MSNTKLYSPTNHLLRQKPTRKTRNVYDLVYDMLVLLSRSPLGLTKSRLVENMGLPNSYKKMYFDDILLKKGLVQLHPKTRQFNFDMFEVSGKGYLYIQYHKETRSILE